MRRLPVVPSAIACVLLVAALADRTAPAPSVPEVLIGDVLPLTGNFASLGQQYLWAGQTVEDIINNDYADLAVPLGPGKGFSGLGGDRKSTRLNSSHSQISYAVFCLKKKKNVERQIDSPPIT